jgi:hypothetical protein
MKLSDPTPKEEIKSRQGPGGRMLDYIDARFVMDRLDAAVGPHSWQDKYEDAGNGSVRCGIGIRQPDGWVWKWDVGDERCPDHHTVWRLVPAGVSKTSGKAYDAFYACPERGCKRRPSKAFLAGQELAA